jgi:hypothetical protein
MGLAVRAALKATRLSRRLLEIKSLSTQGKNQKEKAKRMKGALSKLSELNPKKLQKGQSSSDAPPLKTRISTLQSQLSRRRTRRQAIQETAELVNTTVSKAQTLKSLEMIRVAAKATKIAGMIIAGFTGFTTLGPALVAGSALVSFAVWGYSSFI